MRREGRRAAREMLRPATDTCHHDDDDHDHDDDREGDGDDDDNGNDHEDGDDNNNNKDDEKEAGNDEARNRYSEGSEEKETKNNSFVKFYSRYVIAKYFNCLSLYPRTLWNISDITFPYIFVII